MSEPIYGWTPVQCADCERVYTPNAESDPKHPRCPDCGSSLYGAPATGTEPNR